MNSFKQMSTKIARLRAVDIAMAIMAVTGMLFTPHLYAFTKLKNGIETITTSYLVPLAGAVAGASFILFVTLSLFKQDEYQKKAGNVAILSFFIGAGLDVINTLIQSFS